MKPSQPIVWSAFPRSLLIVDGRAPMRWSREAEHRTFWLDLFFRSWRWIHRFSLVQPKLQEGPLFGDTLAAVTGMVDRSETVTSNETGKSQLLRNEIGSKRRPDQNRELTNVATRKMTRTDVKSRRNAEKGSYPSTDLNGVKLAVELKHRAAIGLLKHLAEKSNPVSQPTATRGKVSTSLAKPNQARHNPFGLVENRNACRHWFQNLTRRIEHCLSRRTRGAVFEDPRLSFVDSAATVVEIAPLWEQSIDPLSRPCASQVMLERLVDKSAANGVSKGTYRPARETKSQTGNIDSPNRSFSTTSANKGDGRERQSSMLPVAESVPTLEKGALRDNSIGITESTADAPSTSDQLNLDRIDPNFGHEPIQDLSRGQSLLDIPVNRVTSRSPTQFSSNEVKHPFEKHDDDSDMPILADKLKRILDEQARRYGIDV